MPIRNFRDTQGEQWRVWNVAPLGAVEQERRAADRRQARSETYTGPERRTGQDRRKRTPSLMTPGLEGGWLCFECEGLKRRLTPIPSGWEVASEDQLEELVRRARPVAPRPPLVLSGEGETAGVN